jgi:small conductance mechanosensitive channel
VIGPPLAIATILIVGLIARFTLHRLVDRLVRKAEVGVLPDRVSRMSMGSAKGLESKEPRDTVVDTRRVQRAQTMGSLLKSIITGVVGRPRSAASLSSTPSSVGAPLASFFR